ncbi:MAG: glycosyltransferase family 4 protein [Rhodanobacteraceae bacterium]|nr:glycosyltransferase family 4 protein [Rhodanobacteraceae bacterium]
MHILFLTDNFPPEVNAPASRTCEHTREWVRAGAKVTVITGAPNFPKGSVFPGYRNRLWQRETIDGIEVIRVWTYITANEGFAKRIADYMSFMLSASLAALFVRKVDVVLGTSPQFFTACAGWFVGAVKRRPFVFELRDLWPESIKAVGAMSHSRAIAMLERIEWFLYRNAAHIVSVTESFRAHLMAGGIPAERITVITNGVDLTNFSPRGKDSELQSTLGLAGAFVAGYIGTHGLAHGLGTLLDVAAMLPQLADGRRLVLVLVGDGAEKRALQQRAAQENLGNVIFVDTVSKQDIVRYWSLLDACIVHLKRTPLFETVIPSKLFEAMGMGVPVVLGVAGEAASIVTREACGRVVEPESVGAIAAALSEIAMDPALAAGFRDAGLAAARKYERSALAARMLAVLEAVAGKPGHDR